MKINVSNFPCQSQTVEKHIKLVTEASDTVYGQES